MTLQLICYFKIFYVAFPANMEIFLEQFTRLVEFDILNPETIIQKIIDDAEFRLIDWLLGKNKFEEPEKHSIANDLRFWIISGSLFFLVLILVVFLSLYRRYT